MDKQFFIKWFTDLKNDGVSEDEILDVLEFDSDVYPDMKLMEEAKSIVYKDDGACKCFDCKSSSRRSI